MGNSKLDRLLKQRIENTKQSTERQLADDAYSQIFQKNPSPISSRFCDIPISKLRPFFTADIGFHPYPPSKLKAFSEQLAQDGLFERVIVRPISGDDNYEILAGHNRTNAGKLADWETIPCEIVEADDERAITIAIATNLMRRQDLTIIERGQAYKTLLDTKNQQGYRSDIVTSGENRQKYSARQIVAEFFGVTEYEIRKAIKLTQLIPQLAQILEHEPKKLNLACAELIADYDVSSQAAFLEICQIDGYYLNKATVKYIINQCPVSNADGQAIYAAWRTARANADMHRAELPKKISFDRKRFAPYLTSFSSDKEIENLFLEFLQVRSLGGNYGQQD